MTLAPDESVFEVLHVVAGWTAGVVRARVEFRTVVDHAEPHLTVVRVEPDTDPRRAGVFDRVVHRLEDDPERMLDRLVGGS